MRNRALEINLLSFTAWRLLFEFSFTSFVFFFFFRNKPEAVEVTFAGKLHSSLDFSEKRAGSNSLSTVMPGVLKFTQHCCRGGELCRGRQCGHPAVSPELGLCQLPRYFLCPSAFPGTLPTAVSSVVAAL